MTFKLDFGNYCVVKELELAHDEIITKWNDRTSDENDRLVGELNQTVNILTFRVRCLCHDIRCRWWDAGRCRCSGEVGCFHVGFEIRNRPSNPDEVSLSEIEKAKTETPPEELARKEGEFFIVWKVRVAYLIYQRALAIHSILEGGAIPYTYNTWREEDISQRATNFERTVTEVRSLGSDYTGDLTLAVGCLACGRIFQTLEYLYAHVDLRRFRGETNHNSTYVVGPSLCDTVRPTATNYQPPIPSPDSIPEPPPFHRNAGPDRIDGVIRNSGETTFDFIENVRNLVDTIRDETDSPFPEATGCSACGNVYANETDYYRHAHVVHGYGLTAARDHEIT